MARHDVKVNIVASIDCQRLLTDAALACFTAETGTITKIKVANKTKSSRHALWALQVTWHERRSAMNCGRSPQPLLPVVTSSAKGGRPRVDDRAALNGILFVLHTGIPWEDLPQELGFGSGMTCWRRLRDWQANGVWERLHLALLKRLASMTRSTGGGRASTARR